MEKWFNLNKLNSLNFLILIESLIVAEFNYISYLIINLLSLIYLEYVYVSF